MIQRPISVYINWSTYDELSDNVELTEQIAMRQLDELLRLRRSGVRLDYYLMDCFWYARDSGYRQWRKPHWPDGPDRWLDKCLSTDVKPGLWVATNNCGGFAGLAPHPAWRDSLVEGGWACCMFVGGFLQHFMESLHLWYERGVRLYKFDFANLSAATPQVEQTMLPSEIRQANIMALSSALKAFRQSHPQVVLIAYNGFEEGPHMSNTSVSPRKFIDTRWLDVFDSVYCGDPRPADVPAMNFWRSKDVYSDHMVRLFEGNGYPLSRIDNAGFMIGTTGTCYYRGPAAWKGMLLLSLARGGWVNTYYGNLDLLGDAKAKWFAKIQAMFLPLQEAGHISTFGALPGSGRPYGFAAMRQGDGLLAVLNPSQAIASLELPVSGTPMRLLFRDDGLEPRIERDRITLGPEQLALIGVGSYAQAGYDLGLQEDVVIPRSIQPIEAAFAPDGEKAITATLPAPKAGTLRIILRQLDERNQSKRTTGGAPPKGTPLGQMLRIEAHQGAEAIPVTIQYDKAIWSGLSWAVGEIDARTSTVGDPLAIRCSTTERDKVTLKGELHLVDR